jgi:hypothetical protein
MDEQINIFNDDNLIRLIKEEFNENDNQLFKMSFQLYNISHNKPNDYIIDLDDIWKWIGFSRKDPAKRLLFTQFKEGVHYKRYGNFPPFGGKLSWSKYGENFINYRRL